MIDPIAQNICNICVAGALSLKGTISAQYAGALAIKIAVAEVEDEDEAVQEHETADSRPPIPDPRGDGASNKDTNEGTERSAALES
jgi:hypothetical protein